MELPPPRQVNGATLLIGAHRIMKTSFAIFAVAALALAAATPADAKGCLKGAVVGGVAIRHSLRGWF